MDNRSSIISRRLSKASISHRISIRQTSSLNSAQALTIFKSYTYKQYDETKSHYSEYKLMLITALIFLLGSFAAIGDAYLYMFYTVNTNNYSFNIGYQNGYLITPFYDMNKTFTKEDILTPSEMKKIIKQKKDVEEYKIFQYIKYYNDTKGKEAYRLFAVYFIFAVGELLCSALAFVMRKPRKDWKTDTTISYIFESVGNFSLPGIIILWMYISLGNEMKYFIFLIAHAIIHYLSISLNAIALGLKIYCIYITYTTYYFDNIKFCESKKFF